MNLILGDQHCGTHFNSYVEVYDQSTCHLPHSTLCQVWCGFFSKAELGPQCLCVHVAYCLSTLRL